MILNQIVAVSSNLAIGKNNDLLWHYPEDLKFFKDTTLNKIIIMGRKTFDSILKPRGKPLPNRFHIVISRSEPAAEIDQVRFVKSLKEAYATADMLIKLHNWNEEVFVVGGAEIYHQSLLDCRKLYITRINKNFDGDVYYSVEYKSHFLLDSVRASSVHPELSYEVWISAPHKSL
ncbi:MAG: dihydrofolate reductase [Moraxellaceae bacterium]|nr:dihydrofolate reductase [Pseudobdellovibrionaceae bacterium]